MTTPFPTAEVGGVPLALADAPEILEWVTSRVTAGDRCAILNHLAAHPTVEARRDEALRAVLQRADVNAADGWGTVWGARVVSGGDLPRARVYGPDFMLAAIEKGLDAGWRHAFLGGTDEVLPRLVQHLEQRYPEIEIAASHAPPFRSVTAGAVAEDLAHLGLSSPVDILWVGLGVPKQILWADHARPDRPAAVVATVGAAFDFHAGAVSQAPPFMQEHGLEWLHRVTQDPRRLLGRYAVGNARHILGVARDRRRARSAS